MVKYFGTNLGARRGGLHRARPQIGRSVPCGSHLTEANVVIVLFMQFPDAKDGLPDWSGPAGAVHGTALPLEGVLDQLVGGRCRTSGALTIRCMLILGVVRLTRSSNSSCWTSTSSKFTGFTFSCGLPVSSRGDALRAHLCVNS